LGVNRQIVGKGPGTLYERRQEKNPEGRSRLHKQRMITREKKGGVYSKRLGAEDEKERME